MKECLPAFLIAALLLSGCVQGPAYGNAPNNSGSKGANYPNVTVQQQNAAAPVQNISACDAEQDLEKKARCYERIAQAAADETVCDIIQPQGEPESCNESYISILAPWGCGQSMTKDDCYSGIALSKKNASICESMQYKNLEIGCLTDLAAATGNMTLCDTLGQIALPVYYNNTINDTSDYIESCYSEVAKTKWDYHICEKIEKNGWIRDDCYKEIAVSKKDPVICAEIGNVGNMDECYSQIAVSKSNLSLCDLVQDASDKDFCIIWAAPVTNNLSACGTLVNESHKSLCYREVGEQTLNVSVCAMDTSQYDKDACYSAIGHRKKDSGICGMVQDQPTREYCYSDVASWTLNLQTCDLIQDQQRRDDCRTSVKASMGIYN